MERKRSSARRRRSDGGNVAPSSSGAEASSSSIPELTTAASQSTSSTTYIGMQTRSRSKRLHLRTEVVPSSPAPPVEPAVESTAPSEPLINNLNEDCLRHIFDLFSLQEQVQLRRVCTQWKDLVGEMCRSKRSLKLFIGRQAVNEYYHKAKMLLPVEEDLQLSPIGPFNDDLILKREPFELVQPDARLAKERIRETHFLSALFPSVTTLALAVEATFFDSYRQHQYDLSRLIVQWPGLSTLIIANLPKYPECCCLECYENILSQCVHIEWQENALWSVIINKLPALASLYVLDITNVNFISKQMEYDVRRALAKLRQCTLYQDYSLLQNLNFQFADLKKTTTLRIRYDYGANFSQLDWFIVDDLPALGKSLKTSLSHLELSISPQVSGFADHFTNLCRLFDRLTFLQMHLGIPMPNLRSTLDSLAQLRRLVELRICFSVPQLAADLDPLQLPVLTSLRILYLSIAGPFDTPPTTRLFHVFQHLFPRLEQVKIACSDETVLADMAMCFVASRFPQLTRSSFVPNMADLFPPAYEFMGRHGAALKELDN